MAHKTIVKSSHFAAGLQGRAGLLVATALVAGMMMATPAMSTPTNDVPKWTPQSTERLVKLPANYLKKSIDLDFAESALGEAILDATENISLKSQTLGELQDAANRANGEVQTELRHQLLAEKKVFIEMMSGKNDLRRTHLQTRQRLLEKMLNKLVEKEGYSSPARKKLIKNQAAVTKRFESTVAQVDARVFDSIAVSESKYAKKYSELRVAIERLNNRIKTHPMTALAQLDGEDISKQEYIRQMVTENQAKLSLLEQEDHILGLFAETVRLDAMALAEKAMDADLAAAQLPANTDPVYVVDIFLSN